MRATKGTFHVKMGTKKDRNGIDLTEAEDIKRQEEQKDLHDPDNHNGVITHLEPDILEYEVKWALGSITTNEASGGDGIPVELFQILKDDAVKVLHSICPQIWKPQQWPQDWKRSVFIPIPKKSNAKECSVALIAHASKVMLKILQARPQQYVMFKLVLEKAEEPEIKLPKSVGSSKSNTVPEKHLLLLYRLHHSLITTNCGKFFKRWNTRPSYLPPEKSVCRSRRKSQNWTWNNRLLPNWEGQYSISRLYIVTLLI